MGAKGGRPTVMTPETINKLEEVFAIGGTDAEACFYANISKQTLYDYQEKHPEFIDRKEALKEKPFLKARQTIVKSLDNPQYAFEYMKRKKKNEFSERLENTGADGKDLVVNVVNYGNNTTSQLHTEELPDTSDTSS
jgi:hypothetical protein